MYNTVSPFDKLTWGDPMFAQIAGSDAQAYATDPASNVLQNMTTGVEQAPTSLSEYVAGANQPTQQAANAGAGSPACPDLTDCSIANLWGKPPACWLQCLSPSNYGKELAKGPFDSQGRAAIGGVSNAVQGAANALQPKNWQNLVVMAIVGVLAIGLILLGVKSIMEV